MEAELSSSRGGSRALPSQSSLVQGSWTSDTKASRTSVQHSLRSSEGPQSSVELLSRASDVRQSRDLASRGSVLKQSADRQFSRPYFGSILRPSETLDPQTSLNLGGRPSQSSLLQSPQSNNVQSSQSNTALGSRTSIAQGSRTSIAQGSRTSIAQGSRTSIAQGSRTSIAQGSRTSIAQGSRTSIAQGSRTSIPRVSQVSVTEDSQTSALPTNETISGSNVDQAPEAQASHSSEALGPVYSGTAGSHRHHSGYLADDEGIQGPPRSQVHKKSVRTEVRPLRPPCPFYIPIPPRPRGHKKPPKAEPFSEFLDFLATGPVLDNLQMVVDEASRKMTHLRTEAGLPLIEVAKISSQKLKERRDQMEAARRLRRGRPAMYPGFPNNYPSSSSSDSDPYYNRDDGRGYDGPNDIGGIFLNPPWLRQKPPCFDRRSPVSHLPPIHQKFQLEREIRHILRKKSKEPLKEDAPLWNRPLDPLELICCSKEQRLAWLSKLLEPLPRKSSDLSSLLEIFSVLDKVSRTKATSPLGGISPVGKPSPTDIPTKSRATQVPSVTRVHSLSQMPSPERLPSPCSIPSSASTHSTAEKGSQTEEVCPKKREPPKSVPARSQSSALERAMQTEACSRQSPAEKELSYIKQELEKELLDVLLGSLSSASAAAAAAAEPPSYCPNKEPFHTLDFLAEHRLFPALQEVVSQAVIKLSLARRQDGAPLFSVLNPRSQSRRPTEAEVEPDEDDDDDDDNDDDDNCDDDDKDADREEEAPEARPWRHSTTWGMPDAPSLDPNKAGKNQSKGKPRGHMVVSLNVPLSGAARKRKEKAEAKALAEAKTQAEIRAQTQEVKSLSKIKARLTKDTECMRQARYHRLSKTLKKLPSEISSKSHKSLMSHFSLLNPKQEYMIQFLMDQAVKLLLYKYNYEKGLSERLGFISFSVADTLLDVFLGYKKVRDVDIRLSSQINWPCVLDKLEKAERESLLQPFHTKASTTTSTTTSSSSSPSGRHSPRPSSRSSSRPGPHRTFRKLSGVTIVPSLRTSFPATSMSSFLPGSEGHSRESKVSFSKEHSVDYPRGGFSRRSSFKKTKTSSEASKVSRRRRVSVKKGEVEGGKEDKEEEEDEEEEEEDEDKLKPKKRNEDEEEEDEDEDEDEEEDEDEDEDETNEEEEEDYDNFQVMEMEDHEGADPEEDAESRDEEEDYTYTDDEMF